MKRASSRGIKPAKPAGRGRSQYWHYVLIVLILALFALIRFRLRDFPLERDEGEYAYVGQLMLQGIPPYKLAYNMKLPGTYAAYAAIMAAFGQTPAGIHVGLLLFNAATAFLVYLLGRRLFGKTAGVAACACYGLLSTSPSVLGFSAHATHFVILPALGGILLLLRANESRRAWMYFLSGILTGLAFLMKQPGIFFIIFAGGYLVYAELREGGKDRRGLALRSALFALGAALPFAATCLALYWAGVFDRFWFWAFSYARTYAAQTNFADAAKALRYSISTVVGPAAPVWLIAAAGLTAVFWCPSVRKGAWFVIGFLFFSFLAVCPGFYFRAHYYVLMLPAISLAAGLAVESGARLLKSRNSSMAGLPALVIGAAFMYSLVTQGDYLFVMSPAQANRASYGDNLFLRTMEIGRYLESHADPKQSVVVIGSEPQIYFYAQRHSATGYIYMYPLMELQPYALQMQQEMMREITDARPEFLVFVPHPWSWTKRTQSETAILTWANEYLAAHYTLEGVADIRDDVVPFYWGDAARNYRPRTENNVSIYKRTQ